MNNVRLTSRILALVLLCCSIGLADDLSRLNWINGDQLAGSLVSADGSHLQWRAPVFSEPFSVDARYLHSVRFQVQAADRKTNEPFRVFTRSGDVINGEILDITADQLVMTGKRHGRVTLKRSQVRSFRRMNDPALVFEGPSGLAGWSTISRSRKVSDWQNGPQGELNTQIVGAELYRDLKLPTVSEIEMTLTWQQKPGFLVTFAEPNAKRVPKHTVKLETWDDELVMQALASTGDFEQVKTLVADSKTIQLRLLWDQISGELSCYSRAGELLAKLKTSPEKSQGLTCLYIKNKGSDLKVSNIRVRSWNGTALSALAEGRSHVQKLDGSFVYGEIRGLDKATSKVVLATKSGDERIPFAQLSGADLGGLDPAASRIKPVQVSFTDGTMLSGTLKSIQDDKVTINTSYSSQPLTSTLKGAFVIAFQPKVATELPTPGDVLEYRGARLHGHLAPVGKNGRLGWKPVGSQNASPLLPADPARVIRKVDSLTTAADHGKSDMIYLRNGDVIPCRVVSVGEKVVKLDPAFARAVTVTRDQVKAIDLGSEEDNDELKFDHLSWQTRDKNNAIERTADKAIFYDTATLSHLNLLNGNSVQFDVEWTPNEPVSLTLGLRSRQGARVGLSFKLYFVGDQVHVQNLQVNRGFVYRHRLRNRRANVLATLKGDRLELRINGQTALNQNIGRDRRADQGIAFSVKRERPQNKAKQPRNPIITLSNLRMGQLRRTPGSIVLEADKKEQLLTIPRNRKKNPPTHLIVARNGDMLRGRLVTMTSEQVVIRSRFDDMAFPRNRVSTIVWLDKEKDATADVPKTVNQLNSPMQAVLLGGITFSFSADRMSKDEIIGDHPLLGHCRLPVNQVREVRMGPLASVEASAIFRDWVLSDAPEPRFATAPGAGPADPQSAFGVDSPLVGTVAENFSGETANGKRFQLAQHRDKVVVLDFWATWCGPCIRAMPELMAAVEGFPEDKVILVAVNLQENKDTVSKFLEVREWDLNVVLDSDGEISRRFQVEAIPQTVVIAPGGNIARLLVGAHPDLQEEMKKVLTEMLGADLADQAAVAAEPAGE